MLMISSLAKDPYARIATGVGATTVPSPARWDGGDYGRGYLNKHNSLDSQTGKVKNSYEGPVIGYTFNQVQQKNFDMLQLALSRNGLKFTFVSAATYPGSPAYDKRAANSYDSDGTCLQTVDLTRFVVVAASGSQPAMVWEKYEGLAAGGGQNHVYVGGRKIKTQAFLSLSPEQQDRLIQGGLSQHVKQ
jgi:ABC-type nitrate/sulfonate/bicarbonate transport system substrate-binding protein